MVILHLNQRFLLVIGVILVCLAAGAAPVAADSTAQFLVYTTPTGASVCFDDHCGYSSGDSYTFSPNTWHTITVSLDGYQTWSSYNNVGSPGTTVINANLVPNPPQYGWLELYPSGADIYLDTNYYGNGEQTITLSPGTHALLLQKPGYYDYKEQVTITAGQTFVDSPVMTPYTQSSGYGDLQIQSTPPGAAVYVNSNYKGTTYTNDPVYVTQLAPGTYTVSLSMPDYQTHTETAVVQAGIINDIWATMVPVTAGPTPDTTGQISIGSIPAGAGVYLDNTYKGITPMVLADIPAGNHTLMLRQAGYQDWTSTVNVVGGSYTQVSGTLIPGTTTTTTSATAQPTKAGLSPFIALAGVGCCGAFVLLKGKKE
ncbi:PEGA domain-containing protein [Methanoregula sp.]|uniref:PEGA domain-containing protein n=1 Tax=Methanoregula sp. TaxID=2052170 RepID=UPI003BAF44A9